MRKWMDGPHPGARRRYPHRGRGPARRVDMVALRERRLIIDRMLSEREDRNRVNIETRPRPGDELGCCPGVWIDHVFVFGLPPGESRQQCSLGPGCLARFDALRHR